MERIFVVCVIGLALLLGGCATTHNWFYRENGSLCAETRSTVLGTGETELYIVDKDCTITLMYDTKDTGLSDNARDLGGTVAEGLVKGAIKGVIPIP